MPADPDGQPLAVVFKTIADPFVGQVSLLKVLSGTIRNDDHLVNSRTGTDERLHGLFVVRGKEHEPVDALAAGDIGGVAKLSGTTTGDTLAPKGQPVRVRADRAAGAACSPPPSWPRPRPTTTSWPARCTACRTRTPPSSSTATRRPTRRCSAAPARPTSPSPSSGSSGSSA